MMTRIDNQLTASGLITDMSFNTMIHHFPGCTQILSNNSIVPLHYKYDFINKQGNFGLNYDFVIYQADLTARLQDQEPTKHEELILAKMNQFKQKPALQLVPIVKLGDQVITISYATAKYIKHYVFALSLVVFQQCWFIDVQKRIEIFILHFKHFLQHVKQNKETDERYDFQYGITPKLNIYIIDEMSKSDDFDTNELKKIFNQTLMNVFCSMDFQLEINANKITRLPYQLIEYTQINYQEIQYNQYFMQNQNELFNKQILCEFYTMNTGSRYSIPQFQEFKYHKIHKIDEIHNTFYSFGEVQLKSYRKMIGRFPLPYFSDNVNQGQIMWLITGIQLNQDELFLGIGWINCEKEHNENVFVVVLDTSMLYVQE